MRVKGSMPEPRLMGAGGERKEEKEQMGERGGGGINLLGTLVDKDMQATRQHHDLLARMCRFLGASPFQVHVASPLVALCQQGLWVILGNTKWKHITIVLAKCAVSTTDARALGLAAITVSCPL